MKQAINTILILLLFSTAQSAAQATTIAPANGESYQQLQNEINLTERTHKKWRLKEFEVEKDEQPNDAFFDLLNGNFVSFLAYAAIAILLGFIIYFILSNIDINDKELEAVDAQDAPEENIEDLDAASLYEQAISAGDYRTAIRMKFIELLQMLSAAQLIRWKIEKTNRDYTRELRGTAHAQSFRQAATIYEEVWYGNTAIDYDQFQSLIPHLTKALPANIG